MTKTESTNNGQRRSEAKAKAKALGVKVAWNENMPRSVVRKLLNTYTKCDKCGDRVLGKHLDEHLRKAMLHMPEKMSKKKSE